MERLGTLIRKAEKLKRELLEIGELHPGTLRPQYNVCGTPGCVCKDPKDPRKHGPYYNLSFTFRGKNSTKFIREELVDAFKGYTANYKRHKALVEELLELNMKIIALRSKRK